MSAKSAIQNRYSLLKSDIEALSELLRDDAVVTRGYHLPVVTEKLASEISKVGPSHFDVSLSTGSDIAEKAKVISAYAKLKVEGDMSTRFAQRYPGVVCVPPAMSNDVLLYVKRINALKEEISDIVKTNAKSSEQRHELIHDAIPMVLTWHLYRLIPFITDHVNSVYFRWKNDNVGKVRDKDATITYLDGLKTKPQGINTNADWADFMETLIKAVKDSPYNYFKPKKVHKAKPFFEYYAHVDGKAVKSNGTVANLPILLLGQEAPMEPENTEHKMVIPSITDLTPYDFKNSTNTAHNQKEIYQIHQGFNLHGMY